MSINDLLIEMAGFGTMSELLRVLEFGADVNCEDNDGNTPLHWACIRGHDGMIGVLISKGAWVNVKNNSGSTPLHYAITSGRIDAIILLLMYGADVSAPGVKGMKPYDMAVACKDDKVIKTLELYTVSTS